MSRNGDRTVHARKLSGEPLPLCYTFHRKVNPLKAMVTAHHLAVTCHRCRALLRSVKAS